MTLMTGIAGDIEEVIGVDLTVRLIRARGGSQIDIPVRADGTKLAEIIGVTATRKLAEQYGVGKVDLPSAGLRGRDAIQRARKAEAIEMLKAGFSVNKIALHCDLNQRTVWDYKAEITNDRQGKLGL